MSESAFRAWSVVIGLGTAALIFWYAWLTRRIAKAAIEQGEAQQRPCIVLLAKGQEGLRAAIQAAYREVLEARPTAEAAYSEEMEEGDPTFINIGSGPALQVLVEIEVWSSEAWNRHSPPAEIGYAVQGQTFRLALLSRFSFARSGRYRITLRYQSLSGQRYETVQQIDSRLLDFPQFRRLES